MFKIMVFAAAALCIGVACSKNYLDRQPHDKLSETDIYTNADLLEDYINSFYTVVPDPFTEGNISCITDEAFFRYGGTSTNYIERGLITPDTFMYQYENGYAHNTRTTFLVLSFINSFPTRKSNISKTTIGRTSIFRN